MNISKEARITVRVNDELHHWVKLFAQRVNKSMSVLIIEYLESLQQGTEHQTDTDHQLIEEKTNQILYLRDILTEKDEQLARRDEQIDHLTQLLAMQSKTTAMLTEQLDTSRAMIEDMRRRKMPLLKRIFRWT